MKQVFVGVVIGSVLLFGVVGARGAGEDAFQGPWDLTIKAAGETYPSWIEIKPGNEVRVQGRESSVHPVEQLKVTGASMTFETSEWFGRPTKVSWQLSAARGKLKGTQKRDDGTVGSIIGVPAPELKRAEPKAWTEPEPIFNGKDLTGWKPNNSIKKLENHWVAKNGELVNESPGANLQTVRKFDDFKLHVEYNCPNEGNSGIYLRGRYELQVAYEAPGKNDKFHGMGAIYGFLAPSEEMPEKPGQWETFDITLVGRTVTVVRNGTTIIDHQEIPGITGGALDSDEARPNSLYIQGDHTGGMKYRNITIAMPRK